MSTLITFVPPIVAPDKLWLLSGTNSTLSALKGSQWASMRH